MEATRGTTTRATVGAGVVALHLLALWAFVAAGKLQLPRTAAEPVMTWLSLPDTGRRADAHVAPRSTALAAPSPRPASQPAPIVAVSPDLPRPTAITPDAAVRHDAPIDWNAAAVDAARRHLDDQSATQRRERSMGTPPPSTARATPPHPAFPWGRQPLGRHFDFDKGVLMVRTKRCVFGLLVILPGFSCNPGRIDPEPGQGDLFDPKYAPRPLELPQPLVDDPVHR